MDQERVEVWYNDELQPGYFRMGLGAGAGYASALPGQFVMLRVPGFQGALLRRPFSVHRLVREKGAFRGIEILYRVVGPTTRALSGTAPGGRVELLGPLGRGFRVPPDCRRAYLAAGGIGVAPLLFLAEHLLDGGVPVEGIALFVGGRTRGDLLCLADFARLGLRAVPTTDDGSSGDRCLVTHPLERAVETRRPEIVYACGPPGMLACVAGIAERHALPCQVSVETMMACGIGACLGCAVESRADDGKYLHACLDGPVFDTLAVKGDFR